jgi:hypothetical protein
MLLACWTIHTFRSATHREVCEETKCPFLQKKCAQAKEHPGVAYGFLLGMDWFCVCWFSIHARLEMAAKAATFGPFSALQKILAMLVV